jgi:hypothetical protein
MWYLLASASFSRWAPLSISQYRPNDASISQAAKDVNASQDMLVDLFERIGRFFKRLVSYTERTTSEGMTDMMVEVMVEVLSVLAIVTVEIKQSRRS